MKYDDDYIKKFRSTVKRLHLRGEQEVEALDDDQIRTAINGVGSAAMPSSFRAVLDALNPAMIYASHLHDVHWHFFNAGTMEDFRQSNADFEANTVKIADDLYGMLNPLRYWAHWKARQAHDLLDRWGWEAYKLAPPQ